MSVTSDSLTMIKGRKRIFYFDALRALAVICVIVIHVYSRTCGLVVSEYPHFSFSWFMADTMGVCFRIGVDLFLMLSGALSLGRVWDIKSFLGKRIPRIVGPFLFWGFILSVFVILCSYYFPSVVPIVKSFDFNTMFKFVVNAYLSKAICFRPYWFFWMILGTYLIMPIFNKWLLHSDLKEAEYFLCFWIITTIFDFTLNQSFPVKLSYFTSPIGLVVLGYYLRHTERKIFNNLYVPIILIIVSIACSIGFSYIFSTPGKIPYHWDRYSLFIIMEVAGIFLLFRNLGDINFNINFFTNPNGVFKKSVFSIAKYSYGFYLMHTPILTVMVPILAKFTNLGFKSIVFVSFVGVIVICWIIMALLNRIPYVNKVIGAK